jgi:hypothetical protein
MRNPSANIKNLEKHIVFYVRQGLESYYRGSISKPRRRHRKPSAVITEAELNELVRERMTRYIRIVPYWEIEAWLFQNAERAASFCPGQRCKYEGRCRSKLDTWRSDRGALDEVEHPSDELCFGKRHNEDLAQRYPMAEVVAAGKSLAGAVEAMLGCDALRGVLERTRPSFAGDPGSTT